MRLDGLFRIQFDIVCDFWKEACVWFVKSIKEGK